MTTAQLLAMIDTLYPNAESSNTKIAFMNMAQDELSQYFGTTVEDETLVTIADDDSYAFPTGLEDVSQIVALDIGSQATPTTRHDYNKYVQGNRDEIPVGSKCYFQLVSSTGAKSLGIYPVPQIAGLPIRIRFNKKLTALSVTDQSESPDFDSRFHDLLVWFACHMLATMGASPDALQADMFMQKFDDGLVELWKVKMIEAKKSKNTKNDNLQWRVR